jgi:hypothetical protein
MTMGLFTCYAPSDWDASGSSCGFAVSVIQSRPSRDTCQAEGEGSELFYHAELERHEKDRSPFN